MRGIAVYKNRYSILAHYRVMALVFLSESCLQNSLSEFNQTSYSYTIMRGIAVHKNHNSILAHYRIIALVTFSCSEHNLITTSCN